jgi:hypothetical protein
MRNIGSLLNFALPHTLIAYVSVGLTLLVSLPFGGPFPHVVLFLAMFGVIDLIVSVMMIFGIGIVVTLASEAEGDK